jgi:hypothetical protein
MSKKNPVHIQSADVALKSTQELEKIVAAELKISDNEKTSAATLFNQADLIQCSPSTICGEPHDECEKAE